MEQPSEPIIVGTEFKSPYQWAAKIAPNNLLIPYKNTLLWLEGMAFNSIEDLEEKIKEVIYYQEHGSMPYETTPAPFTTNNNNNNNNTPQTSSPDTNTTEWNTVKASSRKKPSTNPKSQMMNWQPK
ncbi:hypothetical protein PSCICF_40950 [Pseudomonas cichorii]|nr:hypothetical protein [Pseudomonas cichorii]GFM57917.1 hypothetical protein PSCICF_40950 [Pseudomonas cichorii]